MNDLQNVSLFEILPPNLRADKNVAAVAKSLDAELKRLSLQTKLPLHLPRLDELPHEVLDKLAWGFDVPFYEPEKMNIEKKRLLVSNAILQWRKIGTRYALRKMLDCFSKDTQISEWFEYDGSPYHFKLKLQRLQDLDSDDGEILMRLIDTVKNLRSWLDAFDFILTREGTDEILHVGFIDVAQGNNFFDLNSNFGDKHQIFIRQTEFTSGKILFDDEINLQPTENLRAGFINFQHGRITFKTEIEVDEELWYELWLNWIKSRWKNWREADILYFEPEEPLDDDDFDEFNFEGNFLKLWLSYHNDDHTRLLVFPNPRENLTPEEINAVPVDRILSNRRGYLSDKIVRSVLVKRDITFLKF